MSDRAPREGLRRALHVITGLALTASSTLLSRSSMSIVMAAVLLLAAGLEVVRRASPSLEAALERLSFGALRPSEARGITGASVLALGLAAAWFLFPAGVAPRAMAVVSTADPAASTIGTLLAPPGRKTIAGSAACLVVALLALLVLGTPVMAAAAAAAAATIAERIPGRALDNVTVPLATGAVLLALR